MNRNTSEHEWLRDKEYEMASKYAKVTRKAPKAGPQTSDGSVGPRLASPSCEAALRGTRLRLRLRHAPRTLMLAAAR